MHIEAEDKNKYVNDDRRTFLGIRNRQRPRTDGQQRQDFGPHARPPGRRPGERHANRETESGDGWIEA
jgi:hypothetical protein